MRPSLLDELHTLRRPAAAIAFVGVAAGITAATAPRMRLWVLSAQVQALDTTDSTVVAGLSGADATPVSWLAAAAGLLCAVVALLVAFDRPLPRAGALAVTCGAMVVLAVAVAAATPPETSAFAHDPAAAELIEARVPLPTGVAIDTRVLPASGLWVLALAGVTGAAATTLALRG